MYIRYRTAGNIPLFFGTEDQHNIKWHSNENLTLNYPCRKAVIRNNY